MKKIKLLAAAAIIVCAVLISYTSQYEIKEIGNITKTNIEALTTNESDGISCPGGPRKCAYNGIMYLYMK